MQQVEEELVNDARELAQIVDTLPTTLEKPDIISVDIIDDVDDVDDEFHNADAETIPSDESDSPDGQPSENESTDGEDLKSRGVRRFK